MNALEAVKAVIDYGHGYDRAEVLELMTSAGWDRVEMERAIESLLRRGDVLERTILLDGSHPEARSAPPTPPVPPPDRRGGMAYESAIIDPETGRSLSGGDNSPEACRQRLRYSEAHRRLDAGDLEGFRALVMGKDLP